MRPRCGEQMSKLGSETTPEMAELAAKLERKRGMGGVTELESEETGYFAERALLAGARGVQCAILHGRLNEAPKALNRGERCARVIRRAQRLGGGRVRAGCFQLEVE